MPAQQFLEDMMVLRSGLIFIVLATGIASAQAAQVTCESQGQGRTVCAANLAGGAELLTQLSGAPCTEGRTWGTDRNGIWVSDGCRAVFKVTAAQANTASPSGGQSAQWQRGFADGQRGAYDEHSHPRDYREGYKEGEQAALNSDAEAQSSESAAAGANDDASPAARDDDATAPQQYEPQDETGHEPPDEGEDNQSEQRNEEPDSGARAPTDIMQSACIEQAAVGEAYATDQVFVRERRSVGNGLYEIDLDTPDGALVCTVDRNGKVHAIDQP